MTSGAAAPKLQCAIYTRKSTEEGLEQEFNSLDAQREACAAFITSQASLGWKVVPKHYDDGGISGGTMERPALKELLADIQQSKIDVVVVYKIDRLTRSLMDFSKIVEVFDTHKVSFVSVTQQFNTTTSMGRLTLNVLLSFAQFEREVTAERIRDKVAASKKKGMWMGGGVPLGYEARDKKLIVSPGAAKLVREIYCRYLELGSVRKLKEELDERAIADPAWPRKFSRGHLYWLLSNPIYVGDIRHKDSVVPGQHEAIIDRPLWEAIQRKLKELAPSRSASSNIASGSLLAGVLFDESGDRLTPSHAVKDGRRYRYYISQRLMQERKRDSSGWRLPARELENAVLSALRSVLGDQCQLIDLLGLNDADVSLIETVQLRGGQFARSIVETEFGSAKPLLDAIGKIVVSPGELQLTLSHSRLLTALGLPSGSFNGDRTDVCVTVPFKLRRRGVEAKLLLGGVETPPSKSDPHLVDLLKKANYWLHQLTSEKHPTIASLAKQSGVEDNEISRVLPLAFLAPDIVEAIMAGRHPTDVTARRLKRLKPLPADWNTQKLVLGFA